MGHFLLDVEDVDKTDFTSMITSNLPDAEWVTEKWCNDFAFAFLAGEKLNGLNDLVFATADNDYHAEFIGEMSNQTHLSRLAIYTKLLLNNKISQHSYNKIRRDFNEQYRQKLEGEEQQKEVDRLSGIKRSFAPPKPILSPLFTSTIQNAYYEGVIGEYEVCKFLNIKPEKLYEYI